MLLCPFRSASEDPFAHHAPRGMTSAPRGDNVIEGGAWRPALSSSAEAAVVAAMRRQLEGFRSEPTHPKVRDGSKKFCV